MKRFVGTLLCLCTLRMSVMAVAVKDVTGTFSGSLTIGGTEYPDKEVVLLPGTLTSTVTFVLPEFKYGAASLGDIVLVNIPMDSKGRLTLENRSLYIRAISERAVVSITESILSKTSADVQLSIAASSLPEPIVVQFSGSPTNKNYAFNNGGFEGSWSNNEPQGWHSFGSATGDMASFVSGNTDQFTQSSDTRPGSDGEYSARLQSKSIFGVKANGNCTNGQINAGSMTATDASKNYNVSDPSNGAYNTPFAGSPDSLVFWAKYIPANQQPSQSENKARAHAVITTNARYQDPEVSDYTEVKIADAEINYSATSSMDWQRITVPFIYYNVKPEQAAFMLMTFTTNAQPGGGTSEGNNVDNIYLDDVEMIYNYALSSLTIDGTSVSFTNGKAELTQKYSDSKYQFAAKTNGKGAHSFIGYDAATNCVYVYVVPNNYAQVHNYSVYTIKMAEPDNTTPDPGPNPKPGDTQYNYTASTCAGKPYSDDLFQNLTEAKSYTTMIPNKQGGDSIITLELQVLPTYLKEEQLYIMEEDTVWRGKQIRGLKAAEDPYVYYDSLLTAAGCDSVYQLKVYVSLIPRTFATYEANICEGDSIQFEGKYYSQDFQGDIRMTQLNRFGGDSIIHFSVHVHPKYTIEEYLTIRQGENTTWEGTPLSTMPAGTMTLDMTYSSTDGCDSVRILHLSVIATSKPWTEGKDTITLNTVCGRYDGELSIAGTQYPGKSMYVLPGAKDSTVTLVLPDFTYNTGKLGDIVLANVPMSVFGQLTLENRTLYMDSISERATVTLINGLKDGTKTYYSLLSPAHAQIVLLIETPSLPQAILVFFQGDVVKNGNYRLTNGGFEGSWTNNEPQGWHSFSSATGDMVDFVNTNTNQFVPSDIVRPGTTGQQSALISSTILMGVRANGNCTNGQINAGSTAADNAASNYNFSDPQNAGFNTPFNGRPDSLVFWAKYLPADRDASNAVNKARMNTVVTTNARYQDPEATDTYKDVKIGMATLDYYAAPDFGWQRIAVPFTYAVQTANKQPAYILMTFSTNCLPGGGSSYSTGDNLNKTNVLDSVYIDDVQVLFNRQLAAFYHGSDALTFERYIARVQDVYCDDCAHYEAQVNGVSARSFIAFDEAHRCIYVYVIADDYIQSKAYTMYRVEFNDSQTADLKPIDSSEDIPNVQTTQAPQFEKVLYNGQIYIRRGNIWYTISGIKINIR